jgi:hypothetical protein
LKGILTQELAANPDRKLFPVNAISNSEISKPNIVKVPERKDFDDSLKENKLEIINIDPETNNDNSKNFKEPEPKKNNLLLNLLNK